MAEITLRGNPIHTVGELPAVGSPAPAFTLTGGSRGDITAGDFAGRTLVLNIFPSIDTGVRRRSGATSGRSTASSSPMARWPA